MHLCHFCLRLVPFSRDSLADLLVTVNNTQHVVLNGRYQSPTDPIPYTLQRADLLVTVPFAGSYSDLMRRLLGVCVSEYVHINT